MKLIRVLELILALAAGLGFARYRATGPDHAEFYPTRFARLQDGADAILAGVALIGGLGVLAERARGASRAPWGVGRWAWSLAAVYLILTTLDRVAGMASARMGPGYFSDPLGRAILADFRGKYGEFLLPAFGWFLFAGGLVGLFARREGVPASDDRERSGRAFAAVVVALLIGFTSLRLLGFGPPTMGGGMGP
jgi:hypothetical protein